MNSSYLMSFSGLSQALGASLFTGEGKQETEGFSSVSIDSRTVIPGGLFVALGGSVQDGHRFVDAAFKAGAAGAMVALSALKDPDFQLSALARKWNRALVAVEDTLRGLQDAARVYLKQFTNLVRVGITGSSGKTTTKEIAAAIVAQEKSVVMNKGNLNSETGLPLSVFDVRFHHEVCIFEAGMNRQGEIAELASVLNPDIALITNIGSAHIGILGSREAIAEEKKKIFSAFTGSNTALIPASGDFRDFLAKDVRGRTVFYEASSLSHLGGISDQGLMGTEIIWDGVKVRFSLPGKFNLNNAVAAMALATELHIKSSSIRRGLESVKPLFGRGEILYGRTTVIRDCYNSNPESAMEALDFCDNLEWQDRRIYVIGAMMELGDISREAHVSLGKRLACSRAGMIFLFGEEILPAADVLKKEKRQVLHTTDMGELSAALDNCVKTGDLVLLKGSRSCALEALTEILTGKKEDMNVS
ncbi:MAG: UDP-N-acetylmuramoyl-tripeptide--D-alanyl-D-alanine ligase [Treponema sp.]|jgi:UDP-N-acetylmuramoyl-tripeptide--D-alanyl-D-alanine ligase|nr:UDP-N-acetylmuramoyl-tripeptide--D-alanyl-D-alanine ligase [Treponema sp.]